MSIKNEIKEMDAEEFRKNNGIVLRAVIMQQPIGRFTFRQLCDMLSAYSSMTMDDIRECVDYLEDRGYIETVDGDGFNMKLCDFDDEFDALLRLTAEGRLIGKGIKSDEAIDL